MADLGRPSEYEEEWKSENEIVDFILSNEVYLETLIGSKIKEIKKEVTIPFNIPRKGTINTARIDILVKDVEDRYHIFEVKNPKNELLENSKGIAQLLFYDAMLHNKENINVTSMNLVTSKFDDISREIVPRNNLKIRIIKANKDSLDVIIGFDYKIGRPKEFKNIFTQNIFDYIVECANKTKKAMNGSIYLPTVEGLSTGLGFSKETIYQWARENKEFSDALEFLKNRQCVELINNGLANKYNSTIAKLILSSNHGMREKSDVTSDDKPIQSNTIIIKEFSKEDEEKE